MWSNPPLKTWSFYIRLLRVLYSWVLNMVKDADSTVSLGNGFQYLIILFVKFFLTIHLEFPLFQCVSIAYCPFMCTSEKTLSPSTLHFLVRSFWIAVRSCLQHLFLGLNSPNSLSFSLCVRHSRNVVELSACQMHFLNSEIHS